MSSLRRKASGTLWGRRYDEIGDIVNVVDSLNSSYLTDQIIKEAVGRQKEKQARVYVDYVIIYVIMLLLLCYVII